ncbi:hydroxyacylglutathione hydrolase [Planctobacterium marinum]|uniref:Hydroxyacylglutathione hydrolase n=1 Tax=Planctobacterium marinum TaxID=1631968 RepID=A0AA48KRE0_9ALTE|nr:hydroxyacylglutathione hydrolase [Planctobacterium marinum]
MVVDPGEAAPVERYLQSNNLELTHILLTHHHPDHIGGVVRLKQAGVTVYGPVSKRIAHIDVAVSEAEQVTIASLDTDFTVMEVPGHTREHIAFFGEVGLFCGDTLFSAGCGRLFEGTPAQMYQVFQRYAELPADTKVFCTHEYTQANLDFALHLLPDDNALKRYQERVQALRKTDTPTLPSTIGLELQVNPYLRAAEPAFITAIQQKTGKMPQSELEAFAAIRQLKDQF